MTHQLTLAELKHALPIILDAGLAPFIEGPPGIGKSDVVAQVAKERHGRNGASADAWFLDVKPAQRDPVDFTGLPVPDMEARVTNWLRPGFLPSEGGGILFLDELTAATPQVQNVLLELILQRKIGDHRLPDGWSIVTAGNGAKDRAYAATLGTAMANRLIHLEAIADLDDWCRWALDAGLPVLLIAFMRFRPTLLHQFDPQSDEKAFPSPRSWAAVGKILAQRPPAEIRLSLLRGAVGEAAAVQLEAFLDVYQALPSIDQVLADPDNAPVPGVSEPAARYAIAAALTERASAQSIQPIATYAGRLPAELAGMVMLGSIRRDPEIRDTRPFISWAADNGDLMT
ncbi:MAG: MoxR family ATPase [Alphaproteobacteria bacterium]|nr:MoxR family ATPase [Alphaproteobacteria bacterium]